LGAQRLFTLAALASLCAKAVVDVSLIPARGHVGAGIDVVVREGF